MKGNIGRIILFLLLALCFSFQVWDSWHKFWEGKTSWSVSAVATPFEPLPLFTLCSDPTTNAAILRDKFNLSSDMFTLRQTPFTDPLPKNVTINDIWEQSSNTPNWIRVGNDQITLDGIHFNTTGDEISKVEQINSLFVGKCLSMVPRKKRNSTDYLTLTVRFPPNRLPDQVILFLGTRYSLVPGDLISPSTKTIYIQPGFFGTLKIDRIVKNFDIHKKNGYCKDYDFDDSVQKCYLQKVSLQKIEESKKSLALCHTNQTDICAIPQVLNIFQVNGRTNIEQCTTMADYDCMAYASLTDWSRKNKYCPKSCTEKSLKTELQMMPIKDKNSFKLYMYYQTDDIDLYEEYLIYDFPGIVSSVGGSLGLFLGFSFFQCGGYFMTKLSYWIQQARLQNR
jgi:hypothetical protein